MGDAARRERVEQVAAGSASRRRGRPLPVLGGRAAIAASNFAEAIKEFERVLERKPGHFWAQYLDALCLLRQQRPAEARALLSACLAQRADFVWLYLLRGFAQQELQEWAAAESDFQKAGQMPLDDNARYVLLINRGVLRVRTNRIDDAVAELDAAIKLKPRAYQAFVNLAEAYRRARASLGTAPWRQLRSASKLEPGLAHLYRLQAQLYLGRSQPDLASRSFDRAIEREDAEQPPPGRRPDRTRPATPARKGRTRRRWRHSTRPLALALVMMPLLPSASRPRPCSGWAASETSSKRSIATCRGRASRLEVVYRGRGLAQAELGQPIRGRSRISPRYWSCTRPRPCRPTGAGRIWSSTRPKLAQARLRAGDRARFLERRRLQRPRNFAGARLGRHAEAIQDAAAALRQGPSSPRLFYNAARIYAQCPGPYAGQATELIQRAASDLLLAEEQRRVFWFDA